MRCAAMSACERSNRSSAKPASSGTHSAASTLLVRNTSRPRGRSRRAASVIQCSGSHHGLAPYSLTTRSNAPLRNGTCSALASTSGNQGPMCCWQRRAVGELGRAEVDTDHVRPCARANHAERYALPHPRSTTWVPATSPRRPSSASAMPNRPHRRSDARQRVSASASVNWALTSDQTARLRSSRSRSEVSLVFVGRRAPARANRWSSSSSTRSGGVATMSAIESLNAANSGSLFTPSAASLLV